MEELKTNIMEKAFDLRDENLEAKKLVDEHFEFLNSGNTESVSDGSCGVLGLHDVRTWNASRHSTTKVVELSVESTLGNRTETKEDFYCDAENWGQRNSSKCKKQCYGCNVRR